MSSPDKVAQLEQAQGLGFRTYLYFIATDDPEINVSRVHNRVRMGGHPVPEDKIVSRYARSLDLLMAAVRHANRAYIFDNSGEGERQTRLAEITEGHTLEMKADEIPAWFRHAVWDRIQMLLTRPGHPGSSVGSGSSQRVAVYPTQPSSAPCSVNSTPYSKAHDSSHQG